MFNSDRFAYATLNALNSSTVIAILFASINNFNNHIFVLQLIQKKSEL